MNVSPWLCMLEYSVLLCPSCFMMQGVQSGHDCFLYTHKEYAYTTQQILLSVLIMIAYQCQKLCTVLFIRIIYILHVSLLSVISVYYLFYFIFLLYFILPFPNYRPQCVYLLFLLSVFFHSSFDDLSMYTLGNCGVYESIFCSAIFRQTWVKTVNAHENC